MPNKKNANTAADEDNSSTQRYIIRFRGKKNEATIKALFEKADLKEETFSKSADTDQEFSPLGDGKFIYLENLGIVICQAPEEQINDISLSSESAVVSYRPERKFYLAGYRSLPDSQERQSALKESETESAEAPFANDNINALDNFLLGYQAGVRNLIKEFIGNRSQPADAPIFAANLTESSATWGLQATGALSSSFTGKGVRVAVLDTGLDLTHPDFVGRKIVSKSFILGVGSAQDGNGHGTHCAGTVCGLAKPSKLPRYGVAPNVELFVGKVMRDNGEGDESSILMGIEWALVNKCRIISMSLTSEVGVGDSPDPDYEEIGQTALDKNCLIIGAAGNESRRPGSIKPVGAPANSTTVMAVAALELLGNGQLGIAEFSNGGINSGGGKIDVAAPGVAVYSSWSRTAFGSTIFAPDRPPKGTAYHTISGTSMATPHVAGIATLLIEKNPSASADQIMHQLTQTAKPLTIPSRDVGSGLVQAP